MRSYRFTAGIAALTTILAAGCSRAPADAAIAAEIKSKFFSDPIVKTADVSVAVNHGEVTLSGAVSGSDVELQALKLAMEAAGVRKLNDRLSVMPPAKLPAPVAPARRPELAATNSKPPAEPAPEDRPSPGLVVAPPSPQPEYAQPAQETAAAPAPRPAPSPAGVLVLEPTGVPVPAEPVPDYSVFVATPVARASVPAPGRVNRPQFHPPVDLLVAGPPPPVSLFARWNAGLRQVDPQIRVEYRTNDAAGRASQPQQRPADLAAFDLPFSDLQLAQSLNLRALRFPAAVGAVVPVCNLGSGVQTLNLSGDILAGVYLGRVTHWDDVAIRALNPQVVMQPAEIRVIHRSEAADETWLFTEYLAAVNFDWRARVGSAPAVAWPVGAAAAGNAGIMKAVMQTPYSIGYLDAAFASTNNLATASVLNRAGRSVKASPGSLTAAAVSLEQTKPADFAASILNAQGQEAYPIATLIWLAVPERLADQSKKGGLKSFLNWMLTSGQFEATMLGYGSMPPALVRQEQSQINRIQ